ncbi:MAG: coenzyme F420-0:L-glutamate ligase [Candidatus Levybacteria bacterium]|nr:coenzyme F420-0:L-glutamate ligase [Candidatus Levybacteria bacterium]
MTIKAVKTHKITQQDTDINSILDKYLPQLEENSIIVITSKIVALCEGNTLPSNSANKDELVAQEADLFLPKEENNYGVYITIKGNVLAATAGIDESNTNGLVVLWPKNPQESANKIREHLQNKYKLKHIGVLITDSKTTPLRWGVTGIGLSHSGFRAINDYVGTPDLFGREFKMTKVNVMDGLSAAAAVVMGETIEQTPLGIITDIPFVVFQEHNPTPQDLENLAIRIDDDVYGVFLRSANWKKGKGGAA